MRFKWIMSCLFGFCLHAYANEPQLFITVSFSMPEDLLKSYLHDADEHGAYVVFQGFKDNDLNSTLSALKVLKQDSDLNRVLIDPNLFERYSVQTVPTFILTTDTYPCDGMLCVAEQYDMLSGAVTTKYALEKMREEGEVAQAELGSQL